MELRSSMPARHFTFMRINIYSQELTDDVRLVNKVRHGGGKLFSGVQLVLKGEGERNTLTFWLPKEPVLRQQLMATFMFMAKLVQEAPSESGMDEGEELPTMTGLPPFADNS